jgi:ankyrin repeat protein
MLDHSRRTFLGGSFAWAYATGAALAAAPSGAEETADLQKPGPDRSRFLLQVEAGNLAAVERMLGDAPTLLYARDQFGQSAYLLAAYKGQAAVMELFERRGLILDIHEACAGARIDRIKKLLHQAQALLLMQNAAGDTPLHSAAKSGALTTLDNVIGYGPDFAIVNAQQQTVAHLAVGCRDKEAAEGMAFATIANAASPAAVMSGGDTVLHAAAKSGSARIIRLLLQKGADPSIRNGNAETPADVCQRFGHSEAERLLRSSTSIPIDFYGRRYSYKHDFTPLARDDSNGLPREFVNAFVLYSHFALPQVQKWLEQCPDLLNTRSSWDELSVEAAAHMGRNDIGGLMLDRGAAYSLPTAVVFGSLSDVKRMLEEESRRIQERGAHSFPLLWYTAFGDARLDTAEFLISAGANVHEEMRGRTVLHVAATSGHLELCRFFLEQGLDPLTVGNSYLGRQSAIEAARDGGHNETAEMLAHWSVLHKSHSE